MEKIKSDYRYIVSILVAFSLILGLLFILLNRIEPMRVIILISFSLILTGYLYLEEKYSNRGYFMGIDGICFYKKKKLIIVPWNVLIIKKSIIFKMYVTTNSENKIGYIPLKFIYEDSLIELTRKYCPEDHELYKSIEEYSKNKNISF